MILQLRTVRLELAQRMDRTLAALADLAAANLDTVTIARTRFQNAQPSLFGLKAAMWMAPLLSQRAALQRLSDEDALQLGGASGTLTAFDGRGQAVAEAMARRLNLPRPLLPWHGQRERLLRQAALFAEIAASMGKFGFDLTLLSQTDVGEIAETAGGASSTLPNKANPIRCEGLVSIARRSATVVHDMYQASVHGQERDGMVWQLEWSALPDLAALAGRALSVAGDLADGGIAVDRNRMRANLDAMQGLGFAESASFALARHMPRPDAQARVSELCRKAMADDRHLIDVLKDSFADLDIDWERLGDPLASLAEARAMAETAIAEARCLLNRH